MSPGGGLDVEKAVAIKAQRALSVPNLQNLKSSNHLQKMRASKLHETVVRACLAKNMIKKPHVRTIARFVRCCIGWA